MPKYYSPRIQQAMQDAVLYASDKVPDDATMSTGEDPTAPIEEPYRRAGYMKNDPAAGAPKVDVPIDKAKYYDRLESNLRDIGDAPGVERVQQEREKHFASQNKNRYEEEKQSLELGEKKRDAGNERTKFLSALAKKNVEIFDTKGQEAADAYNDQIVEIAYGAHYLNDDEYAQAKGQPYNDKSARILADHWEKNYGWKEETAKKKAEKAGGKGGTPTSFNQIVDKLRKELKISGPPLIKMAREVYSEGKYNRNAAAVSLKKGGMSEEGIRKFLDKLEGKEAAAPAKMKVSKDKVKFID